MPNQAEVRVTVSDATVSEASGHRMGACTLHVRADRPLPTATFEGTVWVAGIESSPRGEFPCRMLRPYRVERSRSEPRGASYAVTVDLRDEHIRPTAAYTPPGTLRKSPVEPIEVVCKRIAGIFGRTCEAFRPPSVVVDSDDESA